MFCPSCGHQNPDDARFCMKCGKATASQSTERPVTGSSAITCPECGGSSAVMKVSAIVRGGTWSGGYAGTTSSTAYSDEGRHYSSGSVGGASHGSTQLASLLYQACLKAPHSPRKSAHSGSGTTRGTIDRGVAIPEYAARAPGLGIIEAAQQGRGQRAHAIESILDLAAAGDPQIEEHVTELAVLTEKILDDERDRYQWLWAANLPLVRGMDVSDIDRESDLRHSLILPACPPIQPQSGSEPFSRPPESA